MERELLELTIHDPTTYIMCCIEGRNKEEKLFERKGKNNTARCTYRATAQIIVFITGTILYEQLARVYRNEAARVEHHSFMACVVKRLGEAFSMRFGSARGLFLCV